MELHIDDSHEIETQLENNKFDQLMEYYKNNYKKGDVNDLFYLDNDSSKYKVNTNILRPFVIKHIQGCDTNNSYNISIEDEIATRSQFETDDKKHLPLVAQIITYLEISFMDKTEKLGCSFDRNNICDLIKLKYCTSEDPIHNINKNDAYNDFYNFLEKKSIGFAIDIIHEYANTPICAITIESNGCPLWSKYVYKFPFTGFPNDLIPIICTKNTHIRVVATDINGDTDNSMNNKISLHYDNIVLNGDKYEELRILSRDKKQYIDSYNMIIYNNYAMCQKQL